MSSYIPTFVRNSTNADIRRLYNETSKDINVQYDTYKNTREVIKKYTIRNKRSY